MKKEAIRYYSTNLKAPEVTFREALLKGLAPDGGLYMPGRIPHLSNEELEDLTDMDYPETAFRILDKFTFSDIPSETLKKFCKEAYNFPVPLEHVTGTKYVMRLDRGPSASFKDFAALMMAEMMEYFISGPDMHMTILTATSGDTGSAVANAFSRTKKINVIILFPLNEVTETQRRQMTTLGGNIRVIAIDGKFDDCQRLVKKAFTDPSLSAINLTSANSINIGRLLPQSVYYFYAWSRLAKRHDQSIVFSVPSGNFGDLMGGIIAREMGLPVSKMIIATNSNDEVPEYLETGNYSIIDPSINCISNAMNVGHPSNFARIISLYGGIMDEKGNIIKEPDLAGMRNDFFWNTLSDNETRDSIREAYQAYKLLLEPHGATAWKALESYADQNTDLQENNYLVSLETAHPSKFPGEVKRVLGFHPEISDSLKVVLNKKENFIILENNYSRLKNIITDNYK